VAARDYETSNEHLSVFFSRHLSALINHKLLWEATRIFTIACLQAGIGDVAESVQACYLWYDDLMSAVYEKYQTIDPSTDTDSENAALVCELEAKTALMRLIASSRHGSGPSGRDLPRLKSLHQDLNILHGKLFGKLNNPTPRGVHVDLWKEVRFILEHDGVKRQSTSGSPPAVSVTLPTHSSLPSEDLNTHILPASLGDKNRAASSVQNMPISATRWTSDRFEEYEHDPDEASSLSTPDEKLELEPLRPTRKKSRNAIIRSLPVEYSSPEPTHREPIEEPGPFLPSPLKHSIGSKQVAVGEVFSASSEVSDQYNTPIDGGLAENLYSESSLSIAISSATNIISAESDFDPRDTFNARSPRSSNNTTYYPPGKL